MAVKNSSADALGNYNLLEKVGEGSMGTVYRAAHWMTQEIVAVKVLPANLARKATFVKRFEQEFRLASKLHHPHVVRVLEYSGSGPEPYLVMEFIDGVSVGERLEKKGRMSEGEAVNLIVQVSEGLHHAHGLGLLHRDVKPDNILLTRDGVAKLADLGLAKEIDTAAELTRTGAGLGTPNFMAPEQFRNAKHADVRCDVYSLGATLYQMISGELPFGHGDPVRIMMRKLGNDLTPLRKLAPHVSERTEQAILRAMNPDPELRQASCQEFVDDLQGRPAGDLSAQGDGLRRSGLHGSNSMTRALIQERLAERAAQQAAAAAAEQAPDSSARETLPETHGPSMALRSASYLPQVNVAAPPAAAPVQRAEPASDTFKGWQVAVIIALTAVATLILSQMLFPFLK
jgi:serine/threonine protein kinase